MSDAQRRPIAPGLRNNRHHLVAPVVDYRMYERCIHTNPFLTATNLVRNPVNNKKRGAHIGVLYNEFLDSLPSDEHGWLIFCHEDFEFLENPLPRLEYLDKNNIYGVFGARLVLVGNIPVLEYIGKIFDCDKSGGRPRIVGLPHTDGAVVDTLDCLCLMVHSAAVREYGLRFDPDLGFNLYAEAFCLAAAGNHNLPSRVLHLRCRHHSQLDTIDDRPSYAGDLALLEQKYRDCGPVAGTCGLINAAGKQVIGIGAVRELVPTTNDRTIEIPEPVNVAVQRMKDKGVILDAGNTVPIGRLLPNSSVLRLEDIESRGPAPFDSTAPTLPPCDFDALSIYDLRQLYRAFDAVYVGNMPTRLNNPIDFLNAVGQFLSPNGIMIAEIPNAGHLDRVTTLLRADPFEPGTPDDTPFRRAFSLGELAHFLAKARFLLWQASAIYKKVSDPREFAQVQHLPTIAGEAHTSVRLLSVDSWVISLAKADGPEERLQQHNSKLLTATLQ